MFPIEHWHWLALGGLLAIAEMIAPGFFMIWLAAAAVVTGLLSFVLPISASLQMVMFAILSVAAVLVARRWMEANPTISADPLLNDRAARLVGQVVTVVEPISAAGGRVKVGDGVWSARGAAAEIGTELRVAGVESGVLVVEAMS
jgi:inner membrane protein